MPWSSQNGGGNDGGPWGGGGGPSQGGGKRGNDDKNQNDFEDIFKKGQDRFKQSMPSGPGDGSNVFIAVLVLLGLAAFLVYSSFVRINPDEQGIVLRFGKFNRQLEPGLRFRWPNPIEVVYKPKVTAENITEVGARNGAPIPQESLMLTGDGNIVDLDFIVKWQIKNGTDYLFNIENPHQTVKQVAESVMREVVGKNKLVYVLTTGKQAAAVEVKQLMQKVLDTYGSGIEVVAVNLGNVGPPGPVKAAFDDVESAKADMARLANEANAYSNKIINEAKGTADQIIQAAKAYKAQTVAQAKGEAARYNSILTEYLKAPDVTRRRLYLETMERVLSKTDKIILDNKGGQGVVPYLPLSQMGRKATQGQ